MQSAGSVAVALACGGLAASGRDRRRWRLDGTEQHHLIDPVTGAPSETDLLRVTAVGGSVIEAEVIAKSLFLAGAEGARAEAGARGRAAVLATGWAEPVFTGGIG